MSKKKNKIIKINNRDFEKDLKKTINHYKKLRKLQKKIFSYYNNFLNTPIDEEVLRKRII